MHKQCMAAIRHNIQSLKFTRKSTIKSFRKQNNRPVFLPKTVLHAAPHYGHQEE